MMRKPPKVLAPALILAGAFAAGIWAGSQFGSAQIVGVELVLSATVAVLSFGTTGRWRSLAVMSAFFALGTAAISIHNADRPDCWKNFEHIRSIRAMIIDFPYLSHNRWRAVAKIISADTGKGFVPASGRIMLYFRNPEKALSYGQVWEIEDSPAPFDGSTAYQRALMRRGIYGSIWVSDGEGFLLDEERGNPFMRKLVVPARRAISKAVATVLPGDESALLEGMLLGGSGKLSPLTRSFFVNSGTIHILAVSGLHIGIVAFAVMLLLRRWLKLSPRTSFILTLAVLGFYSALAQFRPSVVRASTMMAFVLGAPIVRRRANPLNSLGAAALAILLFRPQDLFAPGFQLSFAAAGGIIYLVPRISTLIGENFLLRKDFFARAVQLLLVTVSAQAGTLPISAVHFHRIQTIAPISNLFIVPAVAPAVISGFAGALLWNILKPIGSLILLADGVLLKYIIYSARFFSSLPLAFLAVAYLPGWAIGGYVAFILGAVNFVWSRMAKAATLVGATILAIFAATYSPPAGVFYIPTSGTAVLATGERSILYAGFPPQEVPTKILPVMFERGISRIDYLAVPFGRITAKGAPELCRQLSPKTAVFAPDFPETLRGNCPAGKAPIKFISPKNCILNFGGRKVLILGAPPRQIPDEHFSAVLVDFPAALTDTALPHFDCPVFFGTHARGWNPEALGGKCLPRRKVSRIL